MRLVHMLLWVWTRHNIWYEKTPGSFSRSFQNILVVFAFSSRFGFLFPLHAGFLVMFSLTDLLLNTGFRAISLKTAQCAV